MIDSFKGDFDFLSNFYPSPITLPEWHPAAGVVAPTVEHAFQAAKTEIDRLEALKVIQADSPSAAKRLGRRVILRPYWEKERVAVMLNLLRLKFEPETDLAFRLLNTRYSQLVEGNNWGDRFWGQVDGHGTNMLGRLLMLVRAELDVHLAQWGSSVIKEFA
jgi:ribA/ribD-fused uncharacterized protein